jgi:hypothetical protein
MAVNAEVLHPGVIAVQAFSPGHQGATRTLSPLRQPTMPTTTGATQLHMRDAVIRRRAAVRSHLERRIIACAQSLPMSSPMFRLADRSQERHNSAADDGPMPRS